MARPLRIEYPGAFYHVISRGNAGGSIFRSKRDREKFLGYLARSVWRYSIKVHTYCLMTNHFHLLVETPEGNLSKAIQWLNVSYATYFNRKRNRQGHLFQGRFKSILVDADEYLKELSRYIHLNPVRAGMVKDISEYTWSSYPAFIGKMKEPEWLEVGWLLSQFSKKPKTARKNYRRFVEDIDPSAIEHPEKDLIGGFILGAAEFVTWVKDTFIDPQREERDIPQLRHLKTTIDVEKVVEAVATEYGCEENAILVKGKKKNTARDVAIYLAREITGESGKKLGEYFGGISGSGVTMQYKRFSQKLKKEQNIALRVKKIKNVIVNC